MTSIFDCDQLVNEYISWLRQNITVATIGEVCEITTPFLDRHNDYLQIYVIQENGRYVLSDDGYILSDLQMSGVEINTESRQQILDTTLAGLGVSRFGDELRVDAQRHNLAEKKHNLIQAMLTVNDMFMVARARVFSFFKEDVEQFLNLNNIRFIPSVSFRGKSGYTHQFDFAIPRSAKRPERIIKAINNPTKDNISSMIFSWNDTREVRPENAEAFAVLNDTERTISEDALNALRSYQITPFSWTRRSQQIESLAG